MDKLLVSKRMKGRLVQNAILQAIFFFATVLGLIALMLLLSHVVMQAIGWLDGDFLNNFPSRRPEEAGMKSGLIGSLWLMMIVAPVSFILGVGTAIYLEEYALKNRFTAFIQTNISNLTGVPSIVFGLLGLTIFVRELGLGRSVLAAGLTMSLLVFPVIVVAAQEAIRAVPQQLREASYAMGATKWQTICRVVLPAALPGMLTGAILALSRAVGETAPLVVLGIPTFIAYLPSGVLDTFTVMPLQIYNWTGRPQEEFQHVAAAGIVVLLGFLIMMNSVAVLIRNKFQKRF
ncbi:MULTISPECIES: phosphate ABC transporter permease PstA [Geobacillus]|jgi:phosphate transport system permease protein|uniref:Phosphate transport system permease protein PstA n=2 Tax=Geobacillus thermodenitrificans TaxID=33940 RepID=A4IQY6_GEOTN|nr:MULTISPECIES: phosphate ABC transporter permease PstA [Geobacillus]ABO67740.1 Phosphate ABC transporter [Geobacillus thermodenitrificans NG80-2]ARA99076.1 phosphate ABC transporter, permease protein PstA [Geobacillus thermodenitrificans]ARP43486.1 Phosphate transport system permease protein PstA 1 [Geobacillus thermodenitrificans]ATO38440.1 phosphate ABC transporter, permease protein PstA [Geobacillus thermodenitrificans]KQB92622.1 phosphate ABC transporter permease [Geobacillus sp. PA-3]